MGQASIKLSAKYQPVIVIVDDEELVTQSIKSFLQLESDYEVLTFLSPELALNDLAFKEPDLVIADFLMPHMNGLEFLGEIKKMFPDVPRILLTGYADKENAIKGINDIGLFQYIQKPWDNDYLKLVIKSGLENKNLETALKEKIKELDLILRQRDELFQVNNLLQEEMIFAKRVHAKMIGPGSANSNGIIVHTVCKPTFEIGGDYYDIIQLAGNRMAVIIADLTGHGIQAALCTALLKFSFSEFKDTNADAEAILRGVNKVLYKGLPNDIFAAALLVVINTVTAECQVINCGIPYPMVLDRNEGRLKKISINGYLLGMVDDDLYKPGDSEKIKLNNNKCLLLFTDGLSEAQNIKEEFITMKQINEVILKNKDKAGAQIADELEKMVAIFNGSGPLYDDLTIMTIEQKLMNK